MTHRPKFRKDKAGMCLFRRITGVFLAATLLLPAGVYLSPGNPFGFSAQAATEDDSGLNTHVIDTISPSHVKFNLFDYWVNQKSSGANDGWSSQGGINADHPLIFTNNGSGCGVWNWWTGAHNYGTVSRGQYTGIVQGTLGSDGYPRLAIGNSISDVNRGQEWIEENGLYGKTQESLAYLFDPDVQNDFKDVYENVQGLVKYDGNGGYVYDSHENYAFFREGAAGELGTNGEPSAGCFEVYDSWGLKGSSSTNGQFFPFDGPEDVFVQNSLGEYETDAYGALVPNDKNPNGTDASQFNHYLGMSMEAVFLQPEGGKIDADTPMSFTFSGDDDVWIFIDNVLVADLGGIHDECFAVIDFETGAVYTGRTPILQNADGTFSENIPTLQELRNPGQTRFIWYTRSNNINKNTSGYWAEFSADHGIRITTLKEIFASAGYDSHQTWGDESGMNENTFDQNTQHELKMFYLERGAGASNLVLSFNMLAVPASGVTKTDQDGRPVEGAEFALWPAQLSDTERDEYGHPAPVIGEDGLYVADKSDGTPICTATTDENGHLSFVTDKQKIISFQERAQNGDFYYVLEETQQPVGYRSKGDISLYYSIYNESSNEGVLLSYNYWQTGAYAQAKLDVTMTQKLYKYELDADGRPVAQTPLVPRDENETEYLDDGIIFAVPIKRMDPEGSLYDESNQHALYGTANTGWTLMSEPISDKASVLKAAREMERVMRETRQTGTILAERNARQLFHVEITNIPGDVKYTYPYLMGTGKEEESQYNIAFYFAPDAQTLNEITDPETLVRIGAATPEGEMFQRQYASQFYVSNTFNRLRVQKLDNHGNRLEGAEFSMYQTYSTWQRKGYVWDAEKKLYRNPDVVNEDGSLKGRDEITGTVPWDKGVTKSGDSAGAGSIDLDGAFIFPTAFDTYIFGDAHLTKDYQIHPNDTSTYIEEGEYVILETGVPSDGYLVNEQPIAVTVNNEGVFADAGEVNDGVRVGQYAGWVLNSMTQFATEGAVDETLTFLSSTLKVQNEDGSLASPMEGDITWLNKYSNENNRYICLAQDVGRYVTDGRNLYQLTDEGTPQLHIRQNSGVTAQVILLDGSYTSYSGTVTVNKSSEDGNTYPLQGIATEGTLGFFLRKAGEPEGKQTLDSVVINGVTLTENVDYHVYTPHVEDLSDYEDLSDLFSIETLVQVYDQSVGDLEVSKATEDVVPGSDADEELFFYRVYGVCEHATRIVLAETDENGAVLVNEDGTPVLNTEFTGTLNIRLRESTGGEIPQMTATNVAVDFQNGVGLVYLEPTYAVEHVYIPENESHPAHGLVGLVETRITLDDPIRGTAQETAHHIAFDIELHHDITFDEGVGILYHDPAFVIETVKIDGMTYYANPAEGQKGLEATSRFNSANIEQVQNLSANAAVSVTFTETENGSLSSPDRVVTQDENRNVTIVSDGSGGYKLKYNLQSETNEQAVVGQFALYAGQEIHIGDLSGGTVYYICEYAAGSGNDEGRTELQNEWTTKIDIVPQGVNEGTEPIDDRYETTMPEYRAARGIIRPNATQKVEFTNIGRVGQLSISKTVTGAQATESDRQTDFSFTVTLRDKDGMLLKGTYPYTGSAINGVEIPADGTLTLNNGTATFTLRHGQCITILDIPQNATYEVSESPNSSYTVTVPGDADNDTNPDGIVLENETVHVDFTNIKRSTFAFTKVAAEDTDMPLEKARFTLYWLQCTDPKHHDHTDDLVNGSTDCWIRFSSGISDRQGKVSFSRLYENSQYRLVETKAPNGYVLPAGQWRITTDANGQITIEEVSNGTHKPPAFKTDDNGNLLLPNMRSIDLPSFGGSGTNPFLIAGTLLMLASAGMILGRKLYKKHTASK